MSFLLFSHFSYSESGLYICCTGAFIMMYETEERNRRMITHDS